MKTLRKTLGILMAAALALTLLAPSALALDSAKLKTTADSVLAMGQAASLQYALIDGDKITLSGQSGVYSKTENRPLTNENIYGIGSVSKMYTTAAVMKLVDQKKVSLDTPVTKYIPDFKMADPRYKDITVRMLLNHSSGLWGGSTAGGFLFADNSSYATVQLLDRLRTQTLKADPGAYSVYCNDGFTLAEILVERVSGISFTRFLHENITTPLGLSHTFTPKDSFDAAALAKIYYGDKTAALPQETLTIIGTGGIYASAEDLAVFGSLFYTDAVLSQGSRASTMEPEYSRGIAPAGQEHSLSYGLGWDNVQYAPFQQNGIQALVKGGDTLNYHAGLVVLPEYNLAAAVVSSGGASAYNQLLACQILVDALGDRGITVDLTTPVLPAATPAVPPAEELAKAGYYGSTLTALHLSITPEGALTMAEIPGMSFQYHDDGTYRDAAGTMLFQLVKEKDGQVYLYEKTYTAIPGLPYLVTADYGAQKIPPNPVSDATWAIWEPYAGKSFFMCNELPSSQIYLLQAIVPFFVQVRNEDGVFNGSLVKADGTISPVVTVPGSGSRDYQEMRLVEQSGKTYLKINDYMALSQDDIADIYAGNGALCTIQSDGFARWYTVGASAGQEMKVLMPMGGQFYVYDQNNRVVSSSLFGESAATLPQGGHISFVGAPAQLFLITIG